MVSGGKISVCIEDLLVVEANDADLRLFDDDLILM